MQPDVCLVDDCAETPTGRGMCNPHYQRWYRHGDPLGGKQPQTLAERFWAKVDWREPDECWEWQGSLQRHGYGHIYIGKIDGSKRFRSAHRVAYELEVGPIPDGLVLDHLCRNPICVNPSHLEPVTQRINLLRGETVPARRAAKTHCKRGHPFDEENTRIDKKGRRVCRTCASDRQRERKARL